MNQMQPSKITFRTGMPHDVESIRAIEFAAAQRFLSVGMTGIAAALPMDASFVLDKVSASEVIVAVSGTAQCVGFVMFAALGARFYVEELDVLPAYAGRRIGAALLSEVEARARNERATHLVLSTFRAVPWNAPYYRRIGFHEVDDMRLDAMLLTIRANHIARGIDETKRVFMQREVQASTQT
jgi:GNAT superfamily N-acetyltransferase